MESEAELIHKIELLEKRWEAARELHQVVRRVLKACRLGGYLTYLQRANEKLVKAERELEQG